jgi:hypothetical protein
MELHEFAQVLSGHLDPPAQTNNQPQFKADADIRDVEQALSEPGTTILIYGDFAERQSPLAAIASETPHSQNEEKNPAVAVDAFSDITNQAEQYLFENFLKEIADRGTPVRWVCLGVSEALRELLRAHESSYDYVDADPPVNTGRRFGLREKPPQADTAHPVHLISEKLFWNMLSDPTFSRSLR